MCATLYGAVYGDPSPKRNGRSGQAQAGVDIFIRPSSGTIGIQSKRYKDGNLKFKHIVDEVALAAAGPVPITRLIIATTASSDATLVAQVLALSAEREAQGKFPVEIDFWEEICLHIVRSPLLQNLFSPNAPGGAFHQIGLKQDAMASMLAVGLDKLMQQLDQPMSVDEAAVPGARADSGNLVITRQIDAINLLIKEARYREAFDRLELLGQDFSTFDAHQKARWYVQRGVCKIHLHDGKGAADDLMAAGDHYPNDDKIAGARVRGLTLQRKFADAIAQGEAAMLQFPTSINIWAATAYAKIEVGVVITIGDVPAGKEDDPDVLLVLCWAAQRADDFRLAYGYGRKLLVNPDITYMGRIAAFTAALSWAAVDPIARNYGFIDPEARRALSDAVRAFEPRGTKFWICQSQTTLSADTSNLCYAYLLLDRNEDVLQVCAESEPYLKPTARMVSMRLGALNNLERTKEFVHIAKRDIDLVEPMTMMMVAEVAAALGAVDLVDALIARAEGADTDEVQPEAVRAMRFMALLNSGAKDEAIKLARGFKFTKAGSPEPAMIVARTFLAADRPTDANAILEKIAPIVAADASPGVKLMLADCYYFARRYQEAAPIYAEFCIPGMYSELHKRLLRSYVEAGSRSRARDLLDGFPPHWVDDDDTRSDAIQLAQRAGDWSRLLPLAAKNVESAPGRVAPWLLMLVSERLGGSRTRFLDTLSSVPAELDGSIRQLVQLAGIEIQYGRGDAGLKRLYRMIRKNMHDPDAASGYLMCLMMSRELPGLEPALERVSAASSCTLLADDGRQMVVNIDPDGLADLPPLANYLPPESKLAQALMGRQIGDDILVDEQFVGQRHYKLEAILPVYRHLLHTVQERVWSPEGLPTLQALNVLNADGTADISELQSILKRSKQRAALVFDTYAGQPVTLGICARSLGVSALELVVGWPVDGPPLRICVGTSEERIHATTVLNTAACAITVDLATLGELVALNCEDALGAVPQVFISAAAVQSLKLLEEDAADDRSLGSAGDVDGEIHLIHHSDQHKAHKAAFLARVKSAIDRYCSVCPAYGASEAPQELATLDGMLGEDEYAALLVALQNKTILLSIDMHLRDLAGQLLGLTGIWPQALLTHAAGIGKLAPQQYMQAVSQLFQSNRTHVSVRSCDILWMCQQTDAELQRGLNKLAQQFAQLACDYSSAVATVQDFLIEIGNAKNVFGVLLELVEFLYEPLFRHPHCTTDLADHAGLMMAEMADGYGIPRWAQFGDVKASDQRFKEKIYAQLMDRIEAAKLAASMPQQQRQLRLSVLKATRQPTLRCDF